MGSGAGVGIGEGGGGAGLGLGKAKIMTNAISPAVAASHHSRLRLFFLTHTFQTLSACLIVCQMTAPMLLINLSIFLFIARAIQVEKSTSNRHQTAISVLFFHPSSPYTLTTDVCCLTSFSHVGLNLALIYASVNSIFVETGIYVCTAFGRLKISEGNKTLFCAIDNEIVCQPHPQGDLFS